MSTSTVSGVSIDSHVAIDGILPAIQIIDWGGRITLTVKIGDASMCWYLNPAEDESTADYIERVSVALGKASVQQK